MHSVPVVPKSFSYPELRENNVTIKIVHTQIVLQQSHIIMLPVATVLAVSNPKRYGETKFSHTVFVWKHIEKFTFLCYNLFDKS